MWGDPRSSLHATCPPNLCRAAEYTYPRQGRGGGEDHELKHQWHNDAHAYGYALLVPMEWVSPIACREQRGRGMGRKTRTGDGIAQAGGSGVHCLFLFDNEVGQAALVRPKTRKRYNYELPPPPPPPPPLLRAPPPLPQGAQGVLGSGHTQEKKNSGAGKGNPCGSEGRAVWEGCVERRGAVPVQNWGCIGA